MQLHESGKESKTNKIILGVIKMNGKVIIHESVILNLEFEYAKELLRALSVVLVEDEHLDFLSVSNYDTVSKLVSSLETNIRTMKGLSK